jgi:hypothetical protein
METAQAARDIQRRDGAALDLQASARAIARIAEALNEIFAARE